MASDATHPLVAEAREQLRTGRLSRREFIRFAALLGLTVASAEALAACQPTRSTPPAPLRVVQRLGLPPTALPTATSVPTATPGATGTPVPPTSTPAATSTTAPASAITRGGKLTAGGNVQKFTHPAQFSWVSVSNQMRHIAEYLTQTDQDGVTHPLLLQSWYASDDLKTWTLNLRQGIKFNNGDGFTADDVVFTMGEWFKKDIGSSMAGLMSYLSPTGIEKRDDYTVVLHLNRPDIGVPEHLFHYPALMLNSRTFQGDFIKTPHGTGPYTLDTFSGGERCVLKARKDYWQVGDDGKPLPYLDEIDFVDLGQENSAWMAALKSAQVDFLDLGDNTSPDFYNGLKTDPNIHIDSVPTASCRVLRMRVDLDPWKDNRVRQALKLCQNREKILNSAYYNQGLTAGDFHVYPGHPEYAKLDDPAFDTAKAKQLLVDAGHANGLDVTLAVGTGWPEVVAYAQVLKEDAAEAGFRITINSMSVSDYWNHWTDVDLGVTPWVHRPLGTMVLNLAYTSDANGKPVAWNETRWVDQEFNTLLAQANGTVDVDKRRVIMAQLEKIQQDRGSVGIAWWTDIWNVYRKNLHDVRPHPSGYMLFNKVWKSA